jgi:hypothetical protein
MNKEKVLEELYEFKALMNRLAQIEVRMYAIKKEWQTQLDSFTDISNQLNIQYDKLKESIKEN